MRVVFGVLFSFFYCFSTPTFADNLSDSNLFFDFAEEKYTKYFSPAGQNTVAYQNYLVRYYPDTNIYLATLEGGVYVYGKSLGEGIMYIAEIINFISLADSETTDQPPEPDPGEAGIIDLTNLILTKRSENCADYAGGYVSAVTDVSRSLSFDGNLTISVDNDKCTFASNNIPNHDVGEGGAFATPVSAVNNSFSVPASPQFASAATALTLSYDNAVLLNGVKVDLFAAACYGIGDEKIGCNDINQPWRLDPMSPNNSFGTDIHNAHTQPDGAYHYHGNPKALFDFNTAAISPVVGFAADGFPIFGSYFDDDGIVRKAESSYQLIDGARPSGADDPGGSYDGTYRDDYEYIEGSGDLDACNGMTVEGVYGYYIIDEFPYLLGCFMGTPDDSFSKGAGGGGPGGPP
jgi:hypothetical protein